MELAIVKAKDAGIGWVTCTGERIMADKECLYSTLSPFVA